MTTAHKDLPALLPCPFCGGGVSLERASDTKSYLYGVRQWWGVKCRNTINRGGTCAIEQIPSASQEAAIERWNTRAALAAAPVRKWYDKERAAAREAWLAQTADARLKGNFHAYLSDWLDNAAALARPEPASTPVAVDTIDTVEFHELLDAYIEEGADYSQTCSALINYIDAHVAAQVAKGRRVPEDYALVPMKLTAEMIKAGGHVNSEWLNDYAPIGEARYAIPMEGVWSAMLKAAPKGQQSAASGDPSLWPCGDCGKSVKEACSNRPCGYRAMQQQANPAAKADPAQEAGDGEVQARKKVDPDGKLDWTREENLAATAVQRAYFRAGWQERGHGELPPKHS